MLILGDGHNTVDVDFGLNEHDLISVRYNSDMLCLSSQSSPFRHVGDYNSPIVIFQGKVGNIRSSKMYQRRKIIEHKSFAFAQNSFLEITVPFSSSFRHSDDETNIQDEVVHATVTRT